MKKIITITDVKIQSFNVVKAQAGFSAIVVYDLLDDKNKGWKTKRAKFKTFTPSQEEWLTKISTAIKSKIKQLEEI